MKKGSVLLVFLFFLTSTDTWAVDNPFEWTVVPMKRTFEPWDPVVLFIEARNVSGATQGYQGWLPWDIQVADDHGKAVPLTQYGHQSKHPDFDEGMYAGYGNGNREWGFVTVPPGEIASFRIQLDRWVDMTKVGVYAVRLRRWIGDAVEIPGIPRDPAMRPRIVELEPFTVEVATTGDTLFSRHRRLSKERSNEAGVPPDFGDRFP